MKNAQCRSQRFTNDSFILAGDIGGTKSLLGLYSKRQGLYSPIIEKRFASNSFADCTALLDAFLSDLECIPDVLCLGAAGPVLNDEIRLTKLGWQVRAAEFEKRFGFKKVVVVNDLTATAYALPHLKGEDLCQLNSAARPKEITKRVILAPGTGLGEVFVSSSQNHGVEIFPSEGGHALFAPANRLQRELLDFISGQYEVVTYDLLCSGRGVPIIYAFLKESGRCVEPAWLSDLLRTTDDWTPLIFQYGVPDDLHSGVDIASQTLEIVVEILATEAANLSLQFLADELILAGGLSPRLLPFLRQGSFWKRYTNREPFQAYLSTLSMQIVLNDRAALLGAAVCAAEHAGWKVKHAP